MSEELHTTVLDQQGLLRLFRAMYGRRLVGVVDGGDAIELVFEDGDSNRGNLVTFMTGSRSTGNVYLGGVAWPEEYGARCTEEVA